MKPQGEDSEGRRCVRDEAWKRFGVGARARLCTSPKREAGARPQRTSVWQALLQVETQAAFQSGGDGRGRP